MPFAGELVVLLGGTRLSSRVPVPGDGGTTHAFTHSRVLSALRRLERLSSILAARLRHCIFAIFWYHSIARTLIHETLISNHKNCFSALSGDQYHLPGLSRSTSPSPTSPHRRIASNSTRLGPGGDGHTAEFNRSRRRSGFVSVRALLLLPNWTIGHEVNLGGMPTPPPYRLLPHVVVASAYQRGVTVGSTLTIVVSPKNYVPISFS